MSAFDSKEEAEEEKSNFDFNSKKCYPHMIPIAGFFEDAEGDDFISKTIKQKWFSFVCYANLDIWPDIGLRDFLKEKRDSWSAKTVPSEFSKKWLTKC